LSRSTNRAVKNASPGTDRNAESPISLRRMSIGYATERTMVTRTVVGGNTTTSSRRIHKACNARGDSFAAWWGSYLRGEKQIAEPDLPRVRFLDLFSSVGGLTLGAVEAITSLGMRALPLLAADTDQRALQVYKHNHRPRAIVADSVRRMVDFRVRGAGEGASFAYLPTVTDPRVEALSGSVDLILAGPPCQGHSSLNNHSRHEDPKNLLYLAVPAVAVAIGAKHVVIENVPNVVADRHGVVSTTIGLLRDSGYGITAAILAADKLGWAQTRKRFFLVASRDAQPQDLGDLFQSSIRDAPLPVMSLLHDLEAEELDDTDVMRSVPRLSRENQRRIDWLFDNEMYDLPNEVRPDCHKLGTTYVATYGRMRKDAPAPTVTGGFLSTGRGRFIHPTRRRVLTPREAARIQGFPDWFDFAPNPTEPPSRAEVGRWIGNAVPSILGFVATLAAIGGEVERINQGENDVVSLHPS
jgi:DNA (cytosine-5)-methyltransferase 1